MKPAPLVLLLPLLLLPACGLKPVYGGGSASAAAATLGGISVPLIPGESGYLMRQALLARLDAAPDSGARYLLQVELDDDLTGLGIRGDDAITRERRTLRARWQLIDAATGITLIDATDRSAAGIDVVNSEYAVVAAEQDALERLAVDLADQITARIATLAAADSL